MSWEVLVLCPFLLLKSFFAVLNAYDGPARTLCIHPFLFLRVFFFWACCFRWSNTLALYACTSLVLKYIIAFGACIRI